MFSDCKLDTEKIHRNILEISKEQREALLNQDAATKTNP